MKHTSVSVLQEYSAETEYGQSFRTLDSSEQTTEVARLNKGAVKGAKEAIKSKLITTKYKQLCMRRQDARASDSTASVCLIHVSRSIAISPSIIDVTHVHVCWGMGGSRCR